MYLICIIIQCICALTKFIHIILASFIFEKQQINSPVAAILSDMLSEYYYRVSMTSTLNRILGILIRGYSLTSYFYEDNFYFPCTKPAFD